MIVELIVLIFKFKTAHRQRSLSLVSTCIDQTNCRKYLVDDGHLINADIFFISITYLLHVICLGYTDTLEMI